MSGVSGVTTDQPKLQASFTYDDEKVKLEQILDKLKSEYNGRYTATPARK
ncbi:hypothetical protein JST97_30105 [bacterium]|nr:hypothetical protein [bacterium]